MTLRVRLVLALVTLLTAGLALFGVATYSLYAHSQYQRLDDQVRALQPQVVGQLQRAAGQTDLPGDRGRGGFAAPGPPDARNGGGGAPTPVVYAELRDGNGAVISHIQPFDSTATPKLPATLTAERGRPARVFTAAATDGSGSFRVAVGAVQGPGDRTIVVAMPASSVTDALRRLVLIETAAGVVLLVLLSGGAWLVLRRGLRPLEHMAGTARAITGGDLSLRVAPAGGPGEVEQLGLALNTMLDDIEAAFREREATERRLRQFLSDASHELRTPLTSIQGFAELFRVSGERAQVDLPTILRRIEQESGRMRGLVEDLLLLARLDETRTPDRNPVDLAVVAADACSDAVAIEPGRPITLDAPEPVVVAGDGAHLHQAVANLVTNALRHTPPGTPIEVSARLERGGAVVEVRDHGPGLDDDALAHVFDRFWQADKARVGTGAGLGLPIVAGIAAEHGGSVDAGNAPGGGARFTVTIPVTVAPAPTPPVTEPA